VLAGVTIADMMLNWQVPNRPFTWTEAKALGFTHDRLTSLIDAGKVRRVLQGVYQPTSLPDTIENRCAALALVIKPFGVVCDRTAAWLHGVDTLAYRELELLPPLESFVLRDCPRTRRLTCRSGERDLAPEDICQIGSLKVTTPLRTALDLACSLGQRDALAVLDGFMRICGISREEFESQLPRYRRRRGVVQLRRLLPLATELAESPGESWTRMAIIEAGLPAPRPQVWVEADGPNKRYRLDLAWERLRVAVEYDGREFHSSDEQRAADKKRRKWLRRHGWTIIVVRRNSFKKEKLAKWIGELTKALQSA
jgi:hypothetical protein